MEALKPVVKTLADLGENVSTALADGKIDTGEIFKIILGLAGISEILKDKDAIVKAWKDRTPEGLAELSTYAKNELNLDNKDLELKIEGIVDWIVTSANVISLFSKKDDLPEEQVA